MCILCERTGKPGQVDRATAETALLRFLEAASSAASSGTPSGVIACSESPAGGADMRRSHGQGMILRMSEATVDVADLRHHGGGDTTDDRADDAPLRDDIRLLGRVLGDGHPRIVEPGGAGDKDPVTVDDRAAVPGLCLERGAG